MAKYIERNKAIEMRKRGMSYSQIKKKLNVSKSSLSLWLTAYPLPEKRLRELRDFSEQRIERFRATMKKKRDARISQVYQAASKRIGRLTERELFVAGLFLYWAEGTKASRDTVMLTNTDPTMLRFFIDWLAAIGIPRNKISVYLHLYKDMDIEKETRYWSRALSLSLRAFRKPYIKPSLFNKRKNYKGRIGHGTCNLIIYSRDVYELIIMGVEYIRAQYGSIELDIQQAL